MRTKNKLKWAALWALPILAVGSAPGATIANLGTTAPTADVIDSLDSTGADVNSGVSIRWRSTSDDTDAGSTFTTPGGSDYLLSALTIRLGDSGVDAGDVGDEYIIDFFSYDGSQTAGGFTSIWRDTYTMIAGVDNDYLQIDVTNLTTAQRMLTAGQEYGFLIGSNVEDTGGRIQLAQVNTLSDDHEQFRRDLEFDGVNGVGTRPNLSDGPNDVRTGNDTIFYAQATAIPEPSALALIGIAGLGLMLRRRRD